FEQRIAQLGSAGLIVLIKRKFLVRFLASAQVAKGQCKGVMSGAIASGQITSGSIVTNSLAPTAHCRECSAFAVISLRHAGMLLQDGVVNFLALAPFACLKQRFGKLQERWEVMRIELERFTQASHSFHVLP